MLSTHIIAARGIAIKSLGTQVLRAIREINSNSAIRARFLTRMIDTDIDFAL